MVCDIVQTKKDLFSAEFSICMDAVACGEIGLNGKLGSMEAELNGKFTDISFSMVYSNDLSCGAKRQFRPYRICIDGKESGSVYQTFTKQGLFRKADYQQMCFNDSIYDMYPIGFGKEGSKNPIYCNEKQIALVEKDCVVYNDLHNFHITAIDINESIISVLFSCYMYVNACYKPGVKTINSVGKTVSKTTNSFLVEKYNPNFKNSI